jgi:hypothetical protein
MTSLRSFQRDLFNTLKCSIILYFLHISHGGKFEGKYYDGFDLPLLPVSFPNLLGSNVTYMPPKNIPSNIWIAVRNVSDARPNHLKGFVQRNSNWTVHYAGNAEKDEFMTRYLIIIPLYVYIWKYSCTYKHTFIYVYIMYTTYVHTCIHFIYTNMYLYIYKSRISTN